MFGLKPIQLLIIGGLLAAVLVVSGIAYITRDAEQGGEAKVKSAVAAETVRATDKARNEKERANDKVRNTPLDILVDGLK